MACSSIPSHGTLFLRGSLKPSPRSLFSSSSALTTSTSWKPLFRSSSSVLSRNGRFLSASASFADDFRPDLGENPEGIISGEWPENMSLINYDDLRAYLETQIISHKVSIFLSSFLLVSSFGGCRWLPSTCFPVVSTQTKPSAKLGTVMSTEIRTARPEQTLEEINHKFEVVSGLPVVDDELRCIGVVSKKDKARASNGVCFFLVLHIRPFFLSL
ncbi:hypothetical protein B296_00001695 [Ensete ventricosum]|uniref:CBS domain-containing protein n=1 Tax=Ensete ventricosum TaxID=4639 RepID=A0A426ZW55_ENSVE|nr:hypothetical protein B296_00001695 [Ensete ventricosum]